MDPTMIVMILSMLAFFYFSMIRPENKKKKAQDEMRSSVAVGDMITTIGGIQGKIVNISGDRITIETSEDRVRIQILKWAVASVGSLQENPQD